MRMRGAGRSIGNYAAGQVVFSQGDPADAVIYVQKGKVKITVVSEHGRKPSSRCSAPNHAYIDFIREGLMGNGAVRAGNARSRRLTEERAGGAKSVFHCIQKGLGLRQEGAMKLEDAAMPGVG
jgi:hypothetical protein